MKLYTAGLLDDVVSVYDQTKTTIQGRVFQKTISGEPVLGPPLSKFIDVFADSAENPSQIYCTDNGRLFSTGAILNGGTYDVLPIMLHTFDFATGTYTYRGRINVQLPNIAAQVHTIRAFKAIDTGNTGWKLYIGTTSTVAISGGLFLVNNIDLTDFVNVGFPTIPMATSSNAKAVYLLEDPANIGNNQLNINIAGAVLDQAANRIYVHNGVAATHQYYVYSTSATPTYNTASVSVNVASPAVVTDTGHTFNNNDPVIFTAGTLPTGLALNTIYFVRNPVAGVSYNLSATSGGANINTTGSPSVGAVIGRGFGTVGSNFVHKTGNLPALAGTLLANDSEDLATPVNAPVNGGVLNGNNCAFLATTTNLYLGLLSELTPGATTWPSLTTSNLLGTSNEITAPTATFASWSNILDAATYTTNVSKFITKQVVNNIIQSNTGELNNQYYETFNPETVNLGLVTVTGMDNANGWLFVSGGTTGQRGIIGVDFRSDCIYDYSYIVTKVFSNPFSALKLLSSYEQLWESTGNIQVQYRTSGFGSITGGWTTLPSFTELNIAITSQIQFKICFGIQSEGSSTPAQVAEFLYGVMDDSEISDYWEFSNDFSDNGVPSRSTFRLKQAYSSVVPQLFFRARDLSNALLLTNDTVANAANFEYSTDNGTTWNPLGVIPNVSGTLLRYSFTTPPGVDARPSLREE
jgi:hypothetical protein